MNLGTLMCGGFNDRSMMLAQQGKYPPRSAINKGLGGFLFKPQGSFILSVKKWESSAASFQAWKENGIFDQVFKSLGSS